MRTRERNTAHERLERLETEHQRILERPMGYPFTSKRLRAQATFATFAGRLLVASNIAYTLNAQ